MHGRFLDLRPKFVRHDVRPDGTYRVPVEMADAQGVQFLCPLCFTKNGGPVGTHSIICWSRSRGIPDDLLPGPGRWLLLGTGLADLTLGPDPGPQSVLLIGPGCGAHFHVTNGQITPA